MIKEYKNIDLRDRNSFAVGATAQRLLEFDTIESLHEIFTDGLLAHEQWNILSGGNNVLITKDYEGTLIHPIAQQITETSRTTTNVCVRAEAGAEWDDLVAWCVERGLCGIENLSLIPGYVGAAPVQNIGAYGVEAKDVIESVEMYCVESGTILTMAAEHCCFGYRDSIFKQSLKGKVIITAVNFKLTLIPDIKMGYGDLRQAVEQLGEATIENVRRAVIAIRSSKLPDPKQLGNVGSFFKNPVVSNEIAERLKAQYPDMPLYGAPNGGCKLAAGWLIDRAGWKGYRREAVGVHKSQALVLVNYGGATGTQILELAHDVRNAVETMFGVDIEMEVNIW